MEETLKNGMYAIDITLSTGEDIQTLLYSGDDIFMVMDKDLSTQQILDSTVHTVRFIVDPGPPPESILDDFSHDRW